MNLRELQERQDARLQRLDDHFREGDEATAKAAEVAKLRAEVAEEVRQELFEKEVTARLAARLGETNEGASSEADPDEGAGA